MSASFWQRKALTGEESWDSYWTSRTAPHRTAIVETLRKLPPFKTLLEIGAGPGPNLYRVLEAFPDVDVTGLDVSDGAVDYGTRKFQEAMNRGALAGTGRVALCVGELPDALHAMEPVDVVLSCYTLAYLPPFDPARACGKHAIGKTPVGGCHECFLLSPFAQTVFRLKQLATSAVVLAEPMADKNPGLIRRGSAPEYAHCYVPFFQDWRVAVWRPYTMDPMQGRMNRIVAYARHA